jgi:hypothetical protein
VRLRRELFREGESLKPEISRQDAKAAKKGRNKMKSRNDYKAVGNCYETRAMKASAFNYGLDFLGVLGALAAILRF